MYAFPWGDCIKLAVSAAFAGLALRQNDLCLWLLLRPLSSSYRFSLPFLANVLISIQWKSSDLLQRNIPWDFHTMGVSIIKIAFLGGALHSKKRYKLHMIVQGCANSLKSRSLTRLFPTNSTFHCACTLHSRNCY